jgi:hypothetical protein
VVQYLTNIPKALCSIPNTAKKRREEGRGGERRGEKRKEGKTKLEDVGL